ncbi:MAG: glycosyltransferase family protein [Deltaproteobacteria bacterium]|nr:glycosyltransferase family protein [Deltaproteobacteria bacterium]
MKIILINQARMTSTRLPGKVLKQVLGKPLLEYQIERLRRVKHIDCQIVATTIHATDEPIVDLCNKLGVECSRGSESDVLARYYEAAVKHRPDAVVRVTSDCPLIDPDVIDQVIRYYVQQAPQFEYASNVETRTFPRGMDIEIFSYQALVNAYQLAKDPVEREHVTPYITKNLSHKGSVTYPKNHSDYRWTVDTPEDFSLIEKILSTIYPQNPLFNLEDILQLIAQNPHWAQINATVQQKI